MKKKIDSKDSKKSGFDIKTEVTYMLISFLMTCIVVYAAFYKQDILTIIKTILSLWWLFLLPGYAILLASSKCKRFSERLIFGTVLGIATYSILSYPLAILGIHVKFHVFLIPIGEMIAAVFIKKNFNNKKKYH